jgi:hypothetical protein
MKAGVGTRYRAARSSSSMAGRQGGKRTMKDGKNWSGQIGQQIARRQKIKKEAQEPDKDAGKVSGSRFIEEQCSQKASILILGRVQHIKNFKVTPSKPNLYGTYRLLL